MADPYTDEELAELERTFLGVDERPYRLIATIDARDAAHRQEIADRDERIAELEAEIARREAFDDYDRELGR